MKRLLRRWGILAVVLGGLCGATNTQAQGSVSFQAFYDELQPYGTWMEYGSYGYVWIPQVDQGFVPYGTNGYWVNTEYGNTWVSDYSWGWAPFHYGRWIYDDFYGWIWVPGNEWAPAWVAWRTGGGYYGWAPLMPGMSIGVSFAVYDRIPNRCWNFVPYRYVTYRNVYTHCVPRPRVVNVIHHTTIITYNRTEHRHAYFTGPSHREMERDGRRRIDTYRVDSRNTPGRSDVSRSSIAIYRPQVEENSRRRAAPTRVVRESEMRQRQAPVVSHRDRDNSREEQRTPEKPTRSTENAISEDAFRRRQENDMRDRQVTERRQQEDRTREQQLLERRQQQDRTREQQQNKLREQPNQNRDQQQRQLRGQQEQNRELQQRQLREQQDQNRDQQQRQLREQQEQNRQQQQRQMQEQNRDQQQQRQLREQQDQNRQQQQRQVREQQENRQQQQRQVREQPEQNRQQQLRREPAPTRERNDNSQRRRRND